MSSRMKHKERSSKSYKENRKSCDAFLTKAYNRQAMINRAKAVKGGTAV